MTKSNNYFLSHLLGFWTNDGSAKNFSLLVGNHFDKTNIKIVGVGRGHGRKRNDSFFEFFVAFYTVVLGDADGSDLRISVGSTHETVVIGGVFVAVKEIGRSESAFINSAFS